MKKVKPVSDNSTILVIVLMIGFLFFIYHISPTNRYYSPADHDQSHAEHGYPDDIFSPSSDDVTIEDAKETETKKEIEKHIAERSDLAAQWAMAHYTFVGVFIGGIGIFFIIMTFQQSTKAAYFTQEALDETRRASELELQPYLSAGEIVIGNSSDKFEIYPEMQTIFNGRLKITNEGKTPVWIRSVKCTSVVVVNNHEITDIKTPDGEHKYFQYIAAGKDGFVHLFLGFHFKSDNPPNFLGTKDLYYSIITNIGYDDMFSLKKEGRKTFHTEHGVKIEMKEAVDVDNKTKLMPHLSLINSRMIMDEADVHPSKR